MSDSDLILAKGFKDAAEMHGMLSTGTGDKRS
jgi:hypothetical protein